MDIAPYIADLLSQHDEVNVPSLGTFCKQRKSGFYDAETQTFFPPSHGLVYKTADDNSLLASYIAVKKSISPSTASYFIEKFVAQIKSLVSTHGEAEIEALGTLKKSKDGYIFIDVLNFDAEGEYFGLQPVKELNAAVEEPVSTIVSESSVVEETKSESPAVTQPVPEEVIKEGRKVSTTSKILLVAASLILIGIITYLVYPKAFEAFKQETNIPDRKIPVKEPLQAASPKTFEDSLAEADTIYQELTKQGFEVEKPRDTLEVSTEATTVPTGSAAVTFEIIGAAFARRSEAETYVKLMKSKGVYAKIVEDMPGSKLKISLGTFNNEDSAKKELIRIQNELNKDAWIARVKPKKTN
ncbi:MAG TPA: SPOR domain-containing protein [Daejeonella sp.]|nr:SPOR domain-containing protein [Daejeonella sp.]